ncbi:nucleotidyltransferase family protein [Anaerophaga thermohalophila]|uniref:nucleotidyltransferase family protein n=1 Tax=Anaerophaga thermohalophila TaxID=177400 RepID=UPI000474CCFE|nr:nucleotidyltransferase family protein [Anaerophaga thermohalophila]
MLKERTIPHDATLLEAFKKMDILDKKLLVVLNKNKFLGLLSAGDIQRAIIQNKSLETKVVDVLRKNIRIAKPEDSYETIRQMMFDFRMELCPVVNDQQEIVNIYFWEDVFQEKEPQPKRRFNLPVVIMAGGFGTRLKPITNVLPKPLIPLGEKTILEHIFQRFSKQGCNTFHISVNYKAELIEYYLKNQNLPYRLSYFKEDIPMGTAGSLSLLKDKIKETFFVSNCDILIEQDYSEILDYHKTNRNDITIVAALKHYPIPYGTIETTDNGQLVSLQEKPELTFKINSGMYILEPQVLNQIPENRFFHITHLIEKVHKNGGNVGVFPVSEKSWKDIGEWDEYLKQNGND